MTAALTKSWWALALAWPSLDKRSMVALLPKCLFVEPWWRAPTVPRRCSPCCGLAAGRRRPKPLIDLIRVGLASTIGVAVVLAGPLRPDPSIPHGRRFRHGGRIACDRPCASVPARHPDWLARRQLDRPAAGDADGAESISDVASWSAWPELMVPRAAHRFCHQLKMPFAGCLCGWFGAWQQPRSRSRPVLAEAHSSYAKMAELLLFLCIRPVVNPQDVVYAAGLALVLFLVIQLVRLLMVHIFLLADCCCKSERIFACDPAEPWPALLCRLPWPSRPGLSGVSWGASMPPLALAVVLYGLCELSGFALVPLARKLNSPCRKTLGGCPSHADQGSFTAAARPSAVLRLAVAA